MRHHVPSVDSKCSEINTLLLVIWQLLRERRKNHPDQNSYCTSLWKLVLVSYRSPEGVKMSKKPLRGSRRGAVRGCFGVGEHGGFLLLNEVFALCFTQTVVWGFFPQNFAVIQSKQYKASITNPSVPADYLGLRGSSYSTG